MFNSYDILDLYDRVLEEEIIRNKVSEKDIQLGICDMALVYAPISTDFENDVNNYKFIDFSIPANQCAYLHKYAPLHTNIVADVMADILKQEIPHFKNMFKSKEFKLCCLGGGPGSDAVGVILALYNESIRCNISITIIDRMKEWKDIFDSIMRHLKNEGFDMEMNDSPKWKYIDANLLNFKNTTVTANHAINSASLITMIKFISAAACSNTELMVEKIFQMMRPGAFGLFIDNAAGGFSEVIERAGKKFNFQIKAGPYRHVDYSKECLKVEKFGYTSCFQIKVTIILIQKPIDNSSFHSQGKVNKSISRRRKPKKASQKVPLRNNQNIEAVPSIKRNITCEKKSNLIHSNIQSPKKNILSGQSNSISKRKESVPLVAKNIKKTSLQTIKNINKPLMCSNIVKSSASRSIFNENYNRTPYANASELYYDFYLRQETLRSQAEHNERSSLSISNFNENLQPPQYIRAEMYYLNLKQERLQAGNSVFSSVGFIDCSPPPTTTNAATTTTVRSLASRATTNDNSFQPPSNANAESMSKKNRQEDVHPHFTLKQKAFPYLFHILLEILGDLTPFSESVSHSGNIGQSQTELTDILMTFPF